MCFLFLADCHPCAGLIGKIVEYPLHSYVNKAAKDNENGQARKEVEESTASSGVEYRIRRIAREQ